MSSERPIVEALIICDEIINEAGTNKKSLIGTFNSIVSEQFPMQHPKICVYAAMTNGQGDMSGELRCVRVEDQEVIFKAVGRVQFADPNQVVEMSFNFRNIVFEHPGLYTFELLAGDEMLLEKRFHVVQASPQP
jgi:hypothetical protein